MKRITWLAVGFGLGVGVATRARHQVEALTPTDTAARVRRALTDAVGVGRDEMRRREAMLRTVLAAPSSPRGGRSPRGIDDPGQ
jgi:hypothetical protein